MNNPSEAVMPAPSRRVVWLSIAAMAVLYASTLVRFPWPGDPAELTVAAATLGVAHPTGYPLYILLGHIVIRLFWWASPALVMSAFSASCMLLALWVFAVVCRHLGVGPASTAIGILTLGSTHSLWENATWAEIYSLQVLVVSLVIVARLTRGESSSRFRRLAPWFLAGLAAVSHMTAVLLVPGLVVWAFLESGFHAKAPRVRTTLEAFGAWIAGASAFGLLLLLDRPGVANYIDQYALEHPDARFGQPLARFWWLVSASQYQAIEEPLAKFFSLQLVSDALNELRLLTSHAPVLMIGGAAGLVMVLRGASRRESRTAFAAFAVVTLCLTFVYLSGYSGGYAEPEFFSAGFVLLAFGLAQALDGAGSLRRMMRWAAFALAVLGIAAGFPALNRADGAIYYKENRRLLASIEPNAVVFSTWGNSTLLWYAQYVEGLQTEVLVANAHPSNWASIARRVPGRPMYFESVPLGAPPRLFSPHLHFFRLRGPTAAPNQPAHHDRRPLADEPTR